jgi:hypothetical protein
VAAKKGAGGAFPLTAQPDQILARKRKRRGTGLIDKVNHTYAPLGPCAACGDFDRCHLRKERTGAEERELILKLAERVRVALSEERVLINGRGEGDNIRRRAGASVMREFIEAIKREEHLKPDVEIALL